MVAFSSLNPFNLGSRTTVSLVIGAAVFWVTTAVIRKLHRDHHLPPGPWGWPVVGHLFSLGPRPDYYFLKISERFGKLFSLRVGSRLVVVMSDPEIVREAFVQNASFTSDRHRNEGGWLAFGEENAYCFVSSSGEIWKTVRRVFGRALRKGTPLDSTLESLIVEEAKQLVDSLSKNKLESFDPHESVVKAISNVISSMIFGDRFEYDDPKFQKLVHAVDVVMWHPYSKRSLLEMFPFLIFTKKGRPLLDAWLTIKKHMSETVSQQQQNLDENNVRSVVGRVVENQEGRSGGKHGAIDTKLLWRPLVDLILAGTDTTANTLQWAILAMAYFSDVQKKVHEEIDSVIGSDRDPCQKDENLMPYTHATLLEILRHRPVGPLGLPHIVSETTSLRGYTIPKGTMLFANIWSIHHDAEFWDEPNVFKPERFLDDDLLNVRQNIPAFIPFGMGPRICAGQFIAKLELFLMFTTLLQRFRIEFAPGDKPDVFDDGVFNEVTLNPRKMKIRMTLR